MFNILVESDLDSGRETRVIKIIGITKINDNLENNAAETPTNIDEETNIIKNRKTQTVEKFGLYCKILNNINFESTVI